MPSKRGKFALDFMRQHRRFFCSPTVNTVMEIEPAPPLLEMLQVQGTRVQVLSGLGMPAMWVTPRFDYHPRKVLLHLHGGAYMSGGLLQAHAVIAPIAAESGFRALSFAYRLSPEFTYPAQLSDALAAYRYLLSLGYRAEEIALVGESAGGNLALALAQKLRELKEELPACLCLLSPWTDLMQTGESYQRNAAVDATLDAESLLKSAYDFIGHDETLLENPLVNPLKADYHGFPPTQIHCGTIELLQSDSRFLRDLLERDGAQEQLVEWEGMCHVFQIFKFEESRLSVKMMAEFLRDMLCPELNKEG